MEMYKIYEKSLRKILYQHIAGFHKGDELTNDVLCRYMLTPPGKKDFIILTERKYNTKLLKEDSKRLSSVPKKIQYMSYQELDVKFKFLISKFLDIGGDISTEKGIECFVHMYDVYTDIVLKELQQKFNSLSNQED